MRNSILSQVLSQEARARCEYECWPFPTSTRSIVKLALASVNTLMLAKPAKGRQVEGVIIQMAQTGQIGGKLSEEELIGLLERFSGSTKQTTVKFDRRRAALDSDSD